MTSTPRPAAASAGRHPERNEGSRSPGARRLSWILWLITAVYWCALFVSTHVPAERLPKVKLYDKYEHLLAYLGLGTLLYISIWASRTKWIQIGIIVLAIGMTYGAIDEWIQAIPFIKRTCSFEDWLADVSGLAIAVVVMTYVRFRMSRPSANSDVATKPGSGITPVSALQVSAPPAAELKAE